MDTDCIICLLHIYVFMLVLVCVAALKMQILLCITMLCRFHHIVLFLFLLCDTDQNATVLVSATVSFQHLFFSIFSFWNSIHPPLVNFCSVSQQMLCVCCKTLMSCFQTITHWSHGQLKSLNISKYDCIYIYLCLKVCSPWVFLPKLLIPDVTRLCLL